MILCCGEALIDMLPAQTKDGEEAFAPHGGGAIFNTAIALGRLGIEAGLWCGLSNDLFGRKLEEALSRSGVSAALCPRSDRPTTLAFVTLSAGQARYAFYDENTAARLVGPEELPELTDDISTLFFGGISLAVEPCGSAHEALLIREAGRRLTMIDPNIRPGFVTDEPAYRARLAAMLARSDIVKLSDEDMVWLFPGKREEEVVEKLRSAGTSIVLVTRGAAGATCHAVDGSHIDAAAPDIVIADTVGAGDTFNAGFLTGMAREGVISKKGIADAGEPVLKRCLDLAVTAASITASRVGANPPWSRELPARPQSSR